MGSNLSLLEDWKWVSLEDVCEINPRDKLNGIADDTEVTFVPMASVDEVKGEISKPLTRKLSQVRKGYTNFKEGDVIFAKITPCMENGKCAIVKNLINGLGFGSTEFHVLRSSGKILPEYLYLYLRQPSFRNEAQYSMTGTAGQLRVPSSFIKDAKIPLPPIEQQKLIVKTVISALTRAEAAKHFLLESRKSIDKIVPAAISKAIPTKDPLPEGWKWTFIRDVVDSTKQIDPRKTPNKKFKYIDISSISNSSFKITGFKLISGKNAPSRARKEILTDDIIFSTVRTYLKNVAIVPKDLHGEICSTGFCVLRCKKAVIHPEFLFRYLISDFFIRGVSKFQRGSSYPAVTDKDVYSQKIPLPSLLEQKNILTKLNLLYSKSERLKELNDIALERVEKINSSLLTKAFSGELVL